jgi:TPP-dependent pyruvate/acetoin dehydrogenase alpha subunit
MDFVDDKKIEEMRTQAKEEVTQGAKEAEEADFPDVSTAADNVYGDLEVV